MSEPHDRDREAIMARRRRFIALALGGLTTGCAPGKPKPTPTSTSTTGSESESESDSATESGDEGPDATGPKLDMPPGDKYDLPPDPDTGDESGSETGTPRPCLVPTGLLPED